jgi:hypothetical protein
MFKVQWSHHTEMKLPGSMKNSEKITQSFFPALPNLKGVGLKHPHFTIIKFCQVRSALGCIFKIISL